jgi:DNA-binding Xre family transcriptional regulator
MTELRIKELARAKHIKMERVAKAAGYRQATSLNQKMRRSGLTTEQLEDIADLLEVEVPDLFERSKQVLTCPHCGKMFEIEVKPKED